MASSKNDKIKKLLPIIILICGALIALTVFFAVRRVYYPEKVYFLNNEIELFAGETKKLSALTRPVLPFGSNLMYESSDESVAKVSSNGTVTAVSGGEATITASHRLNKKSAQLKITVLENLVNVILNEKEIKMNKGESYTLDVETEIQGNIDPDIGFSSSDEKVAKVSQNGIITAVGDGSARITVSDKSGGTASVRVFVETPLESIGFAKDYYRISTGESVELLPSFTPDDATDKSISYSVYPSGIAKVENGIITGISPGTAYIVAKNEKSGLSSTVTVYVSQGVSSISLSNTSVTVYEGESFTVTATVLPENAGNKNINWYTSNGYIASVSPEGSAVTITGVKQGNCTVTAVSAQNENIKAEIKVTVKEKITQPEIRPTYIDGILVVNKTYGLPRNYNSGGGLTKETSEAFAKMQADAKKDGINLYVASGYRSYERQQQLFNYYLSRGQGQAYVETYSARPGYSEHQAGVAIDVNLASKAFLGTPEQIWLHEHCVEYGFIIRYPDGKSDKTGFMYEPWHIRYLGVDTAKKVADSGLCLEEYLGISSVYAD